jgi:hypothetical protein
MGLFFNGNSIPSHVIVSTCREGLAYYGGLWGKLGGTRGQANSWLQGVQCADSTSSGDITASTVSVLE